MKYLSIKLLFIFGLVVFACSTKHSEDSAVIDSHLNVSIGNDPAYPDHFQVTLENSVYKAVFRVNKEANGELEHAIRDWIIKSIQQDQVDNYIDACAQRPVCKFADIVYDSTDKKTVRFLFGDDEFILDYTIFPNSPVIKVDYVKYDNKDNFWCNTVEIGTPGGIGERHKAVTKVYGQENYIRTIRSRTIFL